MKQVSCKIISNMQIAPLIYRLELKGDTSALQNPGQFVNIAIPGFSLRRPISVCDWKDGQITLIYKVVGNGTRALARYREGNLDLLCGLGNGFSLSRAKGHIPLLIGGGVGIPPLYALAKKFKEQKARPVIFLGFNTASEIFYQKEFQELSDIVLISTMDGSCGIAGTVVDAMQIWAGENRDASPYLYSCGPIPMMRALWTQADRFGWEGEFSLEERMGCGIGACMGCSLLTASGAKRICREGPVFVKGDLLWNPEK